MFEHLRQLFKDRSVASLAPTRPATVQKIIQEINFQKGRTFVEYGPGDGPFTKMLLKNMTIRSRLIVVETNKDFVDILSKRFADPRLEIVHGSAASIREILHNKKIEHVDYAVSGIPFSFFTKELRQSIVDATAECLTPEGKFIIYQSLTAPIGRHMLKKALQTNYQVENEQFHFATMPPLYSFAAKKKANAQMLSKAA